MIIKDFNRKLLELDGTQMFGVEQKGVNPNGQPILEKTDYTLKTAIVRALRFVGPDRKLSDMEKVTRGLMAEMANKAGDEIEFTADEIPIIKNAVVDYFTSTVVVMDIWRILDPACIPERYRVKETPVKK